MRELLGIWLCLYNQVIARPKEIDKVTTIKDLDETEINMTSIVIVGNKNTYVEDGRMITPRGYTLWFFYWVELQKA